MKKFRLLAFVMAVAMCFALVSGCNKANDNNQGNAGNEPSTGNEPATGTEDNTTAETIKVGVLGCHTGEYAVYGLAVKNGTSLYIDEVNANGGINGKQIEIVAYDNKADDAEAINAFTRMVDEGITALIGDVLTGNTLAVVGEAYPINMPMITASATAAAVTVGEDGTVFSNVFRTCFIDPFQGEKMAEYAKEVLGASKVAVLYENGNDYSEGLKNAFEAKSAELGLELVKVEAFSTGDKDFRAQLTNIQAAGPDAVFLPAYYENDGLILTQARQIGLDATFMGGDGWSGVEDFATAEDLEGSVFCSAYAPGSSEAVINFETAYEAAYGKETLNMFAANAYDAAKVLVNALTIAESGSNEAGSDEYKQAVIDAIRDESGAVEGITSNGYSFDEYNNPVKDAVIIKVANGEPVFDRIF